MIFGFDQLYLDLGCSRLVPGPTEPHGCDAVPLGTGMGRSPPCDAVTPDADADDDEDEVVEGTMLPVILFGPLLLLLLLLPPGSAPLPLAALMREAPLPTPRRS